MMKAGVWVEGRLFPTVDVVHEDVAECLRWRRGGVALEERRGAAHAHRLIRTAHRQRWIGQKRKAI